ncbi:MAG: ABC transporter ATP-binding protein [Solirubrobacteraceae bacterium]
MIEARNLTKHYGPTVAVDDLSFTLTPGTVTGFLGPNGAGKTTTMRMILGLDAPTRGTVRVNGKPYRDLVSPLHEVGALLDAQALHGGRSARSHLLCLAASNGIPAGRVTDVLEIVGLASVAGRRSGGFSLGMSQRLGIAGALLGDPGILIFDEPVNGLDPEGILWMRTMMKSLAAEGRTVLVSSHLMSEMAQTAGRLLVIGRGRLISDSSVEEFVAGSSGQSVLVHSPQADELARLLSESGASVQSSEPGVLQVTGIDSAAVGELAAKSKVILHELTPVRASLEEAFMELTRDSVEYGAGPHRDAGGAKGEAGQVAR